MVLEFRLARGAPWGLSLWLDVLAIQQPLSSPPKFRILPIWSISRGLCLGVALIHDLHGRHRRGRNTQDVLRRCGGLIAKAPSRAATHSIFTQDCSRARYGCPMTDRQYAVNARFVTQSLTGIQRYCYELTLRLKNATLLAP